MYSISFNIIGSGIDTTDRHYMYKGWNSEGRLDDTSEAYLDYYKFLAQPVVDWCEEHNMKFEITNGEYAMRLIFNFEHAKDAIYFKTWWL